MNSLQQPDALAMPFANNGTKNTIPSSPTGTNLASLSEGFPQVTSEPIASGGIPPVRADFNGIFNLTTSQYYYLQNGGVFTFDANVSSAIGGYPLGAILYYTDGNGVTYLVKSLIGDNTYNFVSDPSYIDDVHWSYVSNTPITQDVSQNLASNVYSTAAINNKFPLVDELPANPDPDTYYFIKA